MKKKQQPDTGTVRIATDYTLIQITLTLAVESYLCEEHENNRDLRESEAVELVLERLHDHSSAEIVVLRTDATPIHLTKAVQA